MGNDTMVNFTIAGVEVWARMEPHAAPPNAKSLGFMVNMNQMHLIDPSTDKVIR